ncbi:Ig domain protein group 2 domain protein [Gemmatirosa kalamazoonensis]|uniref:Ig domain protein group 2 domain protein n=1 Tax=Gemmatirosa kalamazoonensis TaxID=861299 RepID=W0RGG0_9BACT|nr:Ig-like domain-containing protein [Gemmatirosa kalamazoonensis]AHG89522.1 Ig domain protein group 2 domain protein [Gemmatirosa kalamazoonensis]
MLRVRPIQRLLPALAACALGSCKSSDTTTEEPEPLATVTVSPTALSLRVGDTASVTVTTTPALSTGRTVTWTSSRPSVATITSVAPLGGRVSVRAAAAGTASLDLTFTTPQQTATKSVFVIVTTATPTAP